MFFEKFVCVRSFLTSTGGHTTLPPCGVPTDFVKHSTIPLTTEPWWPRQPRFDSWRGHFITRGLLAMASRRRSFGFYACIYNGSSALDARRTEDQWSSGRTHRCHRCDFDSRLLHCLACLLILKLCMSYRSELHSTRRLMDDGSQAMLLYIGAKMAPAGFEPAIPGSEGRCLIRWATGLVVLR